jgi:predicted transport protein
MSDIKLFRIQGDTAEELRGESAALEKSLQRQIEQHLPTLLGVKVLVSEYSTGKKHGGRIDTLGIDENGVPVIIEYKRAVNENVINQGLFYLDWLLDHRAEFELLVMRKLGEELAKEVVWQRTRLVCIAGDFTRYDQHAVAQINRNVELIRYKRYGSELLLFDLVNAANEQFAEESIAEPESVPPEAAERFSRPLELLERADQDLRDLYSELLAFAKALGDDVQVEPLKMDIAFRRIKNFMCVEPHPSKGTLTLFLKVEPRTVELHPGFTRDVSEIGHYGTGDLEVSLSSRADLVRAQPLIVKSYEAS